MRIAAHGPCDEARRAEAAIGARRRAKQETHRAVQSVWELCRTAQWCDAADAGRIAAPIACRVMRVHFGDRTAEMHHEHSDTPVPDCFAPTIADCIHSSINAGAKSRV